jgi:hypothetical protein
VSRRRRLAPWIAGALAAQACVAAPALADVTLGGRVDVPAGGVIALRDAAPSALGQERAVVAVTTSDAADLTQAPVDLVVFGVGAAGTVTTTQRLPVAAGVTDVALADLDGDAIPEVLLLDGAADTVTVVRRSDAGLAPAASFPTGERPREVTAGDIDGDGRLDLVVTLEGQRALPDGDPTIVRLMGDGAGALGPPQLVLQPVPQLDATSYLAPKLVDLDGGGGADLVVRMAFPATSGTGTSFTTVVMLADGSGGFGAPFARPGGGLFRGLTGELTGDGAQDLVFSVPEHCSLGFGGSDCFPAAGTVLSGAAPPAVPTPTRVGAADRRIVGIAQIDGTGPEDLLLAGDPAAPGGPPHLLIASRGNGEFGDEVALPAVTDVDAVIAADLNGDGAADLAARRMSAPGTVSLLFNQADLRSPGLDFAGVPLGSAGPTRPLEIRNEGAAPLALGTTASVTGAAAADYEVAGDACSGATLAAGRACAVQIRFRPGARGPRAAQLLIAGGGADPRSFGLTGTGLAVPGPAAGAPRCLPAPRAPRPAGRGAVSLTPGQLRTNQRIGQAAIRRLNAVEAWLAAGIQARDLCGGAIGSALLAPGIASAESPADLAAPTPPDPRPVVVRRARDERGRVTLSAAQLRINQRIYGAAIRRAKALEARLEGKLTGGDLAAGAVGRNALHPRLLITSAPAAASEPAPSRTGSTPPAAGGGKLALTAAQLRINQRIAQAAVRRANALVARLEAGLTGDAFAPGSITSRNLAGEVLQP